MGGRASKSIPTLYHGSPTRSVRLFILMEELGVPFDIKPVDFLAGEHRLPDYVAFTDGWAVVPTYIDGEDKILESGASMQFILEKYGKGRLQPAVGSKERAAFLYWLWWGEATFSPAIVRFLQHTALFPEAQRDPKIAAQAKASTLQCVDYLEKRLEGRDFVAGAFSAADILLVHGLFLTFGFAKIADDKSHPRTAALFARIMARDSTKKAYGKLAAA